MLITKKRSLILGLLSLLSSSPLWSQADMELSPIDQSPPKEESTRQTYVSFAGLWVDNNTDGAPGGALRLGWHFAGKEPYNISTDVEFEASYWSIDNSVNYGREPGKAETKNLPLMANIRVNVPLSDTGLFLYGGGGIGATVIQIKGTSTLGRSVDDTGTVFTYGFFAGLGANLTDRASLRAGYRALWLGDDTFNDGTVDVKMTTERSDIFELAIRLDF